MSLQWQLVAGLLYAEIGAIAFLCLPLPVSWQRYLTLKIGNSQLVQKAKPVLQVTFLAVFLLFLDAIREMWRADESLASSSQQKGVKDVHMYTHLQMHLFRAQRNFYITGFSLFLLMVLSRFYRFMYDIASVEAVVTQSNNARKEYDRMVDEKKTLGEKVKKLDSSLKEATDDLKSTKTNLTAVQSQAKNTETEYMRLLDEVSASQKKGGASSEPKKDK
eukprot:Opistho-2@34088